MSDSQIGVSGFDLEILLNRIANLKHIWRNQDQDCGQQQQQQQTVPAAGDVSNESKVAPERVLPSEDSSSTLQANPRGMELDEKKMRGPGAKASARSKRTYCNRNSASVTITSSEELAASTPLGFRDSSKKARKKDYQPKPMSCNFCKNNREVRDIYLTHYLYDPVTKVLSCPVLRKHICEICGDTGDNAHTLQYCRLNRAMGGAYGNVPKMLYTLTVTNSAGRIRRK